MSRRKRVTRNLGRLVVEPLPARTTKGWVRFEHEREPYGLFSYISEARCQLTGEMLVELETLLQWFRSQLEAPELSSSADERFWFCEEAEQHIARARRLAELCRLAGVPIVERRTTRIPGKVRWEDPRQVAVLTYRDAKSG